MADRWTFTKLKPQKNNFAVPDGNQARNLLMTGEAPQPMKYRGSDGALKCNHDMLLTIDQNFIHKSYECESRFGIIWNQFRENYTDIVS